MSRWNTISDIRRKYQLDREVPKEISNEQRIWWWFFEEKCLERPRSFPNNWTTVTWSAKATNWRVFYIYMGTSTEINSTPRVIYYGMTFSTSSYHLSNFAWLKPQLLRTDVTSAGAWVVCDRKNTTHDASRSKQSTKTNVESVLMATCARNAQSSIPPPYYTIMDVNENSPFSFTSHD